MITLMPAEPFSPAQVLAMLFDVGLSEEDCNKMNKIFIHYKMLFTRCTCHLLLVEKEKSAVVAGPF